MIAEDGFEWKRRVFLDALATGCVVHGVASDECEEPYRAHHVITQQALRKHGRGDLLWATENGVLICEGAHRRHHSRHTPILREQLSPAALAFARAIDLEWMIDRYYPSRGNQLG